MSRHFTYALLVALFTPSSFGATFYKFVDEHGVLTYGNQPPGSVAAASSTEGQTVSPAAGLTQHKPMAQSADQQLQALLQQDILTHTFTKSPPLVERREPSAQGYRYALPWKSGNYAVSQGFEGGFSHHTPQSRYAMDIAMPVGTPLYAARAGRVVTASDRLEGKGSHSANGNYVRIEHDDGSSSAYLHLQSGSIRVQVGQHLAKGDYLGNSGNTGRSTGPHLHFVVQQRVSGGYESVPFAFVQPIGTLPNFTSSRN